VARRSKTPRDRPVALVGVPFSSTGRSDGISAGIGALRAEGLAGALGAVRRVDDTGDLVICQRDPGRGRSRLRNERGLAELVARGAEAVARARRAGCWPLLVGGDCPVLLGGLAALRDEGSTPGLLMIDGHEDAWPPARSPTGEASDSELAIALGLIAHVPADIEHVSGALDPRGTVLMGPRDREELRRHAIPSIAPEVAALLTDDDVRHRGADGVARDAVAHLNARTTSWWLHVDLDVLTSDAFPAADYLQAGGLDWPELTALTTCAANSPRCAGASVVIYNAELDPDRRVARRTISFLAAALTEPRS
jgi:arginase